MSSSCYLSKEEYLALSSQILFEQMFKNWNCLSLIDPLLPNIRPSLVLQITSLFDKETTTPDLIDQNVEMKITVKPADTNTLPLTL